MSLRTVCAPLAITLALPLLAAPARANGITTYGIIITAMGNDLQVQYVDKPAAEDGSGGRTDPVLDTGDKGGSLLATSNGAGGVSITPYDGSTGTPGKGATGTDDGGESGEPVIDGAPGEAPPPMVDFPEPGKAEDLDSPVIDDEGTGPIETVGPGTTANTPEPASVTLLALAGLGGWYARRRRR